MKIEVWSDYVCPFCYIGKRELENAIEKTGFQDQVDIELKSYQLSPDSPATSEESIYEVLAKKYGTTIEQVKAQTAGIIDRAATLGLNYQYENMKPANTFKAHRLAKYAESVGKGAEMSERLLQAYFIENQEIGLTDILVGLGVEIGLERQAVKDVLNDPLQKKYYQISKKHRKSGYVVYRFLYSMENMQYLVHNQERFLKMRFVRLLRRTDYDQA